MTICYDHRQFETLSFGKNKSDEEQYKMTQDIILQPNICKHCNQTILDKYYYEVDGLSWHSCCLRCYACQVSLSSKRTCFSKNEKIWCREDYNRQFRCQKCFEILKPSDLIMKSGVEGLPYHVGCFRCDMCNVLLLSGDSYGCSNNRLFCKNDFLTTKRSENTRIDPPIYSDDVAPRGAIDINVTFPIISNNSLSSLCQLRIDDYLKTKIPSPVNGTIHNKDLLSIKTVEIPRPDDNIVSTRDCSLEDSPSGKEYTQLRPCAINRDNLMNYDEPEMFKNSIKEKSILDIQLKFEKLSSPLSIDDEDERNLDDTACSNELSSEPDLGKELIDHNSIPEASTFGTEEDDASGGASCTGDSDDKITVSGKHSISKKGANNLRQKRVRTSFKHQQLRTMKAYFAMNHNPDSKDLRQLSQKTGLSKRVLQVWFQNARAKFRRSLCRHSGIMCPPSSSQMQISSIFDESMMTIDKNGNYSNKAKMTAFADMSSSIINHSLSNNHRLCNMSDIGYSNSNNNGSLLPSLNNIHDRYLPNGKQFIPTSTYYNSSMNIQSKNSPSLFSMDVGNLAANLGLVEFSHDKVESFHLTELGVGQKP